MAEQTVQLLVVLQVVVLVSKERRAKSSQARTYSDGELKMSRDDPGLLVVTGSVTSQLEDLGSQVFKDGSEID